MTLFRALPTTGLSPENAREGSLGLGDHYSLEGVRRTSRKGTVSPEFANSGYIFVDGFHGGMCLHVCLMLGGTTAVFVNFVWVCGGEARFV